MREVLCDLFFPRESNYYRSKLLHNTSIFYVIIFLVLGQFFANFTKLNFPSVLGLRTNISSQELLLFTNQKRQDQGLKSLVLNEELSKAAYLKARDMLAKNYWAHTSPDGVTPWYYFKTVGYEYEYAGENLARGFISSDSIVSAWMASPSHRENMLSDNYEEVGFAVVQGGLSGEETTLVVEMFGGKSKNLAVVQEPSVTKASSHSETIEQASLVSGMSSLKTNALIDSNFLSKNIAFVIIMLFIVVLVLDMLIIKRRKVVRFVGHNLDHIVFLSMLLYIIVIFGKGIVL